MKVNPIDPVSLKKFFKEFKDLTNPEIAILAGRTIDTIREWRKKCDEEICRDPFIKWRSKQEFKDIIPETIRSEVWDCAEWFKEQYEGNGLGVAALSKIIRKNKKLVYYRLKKYGVKIRNHGEATKSENPCCSEEWLYYHYSRPLEYGKWCKKNRVKSDEYGGMALPLRECAELAGVVPYTILNWLTHYKMRIRGVVESTMLNKVVTDAERRRQRDSYFELLRQGKLMIYGLRVDKKKIRNKKVG